MPSCRRVAQHALLLLPCVLGAARGNAQDAEPELDVQDLVPINTMCPVMPDEPVDPEFTIVHEGQAIGLCCSTCRRKFLRDPDTYLALIPEYVPPEVPTPTAPIEGEPAPSAAPASVPPTAVDAPIPAWVEVVGRFHPLVVHFPIALLLAGALAELCDSLRRRTELRATLRFCLGLGAVGGVVAALLGWAAGAGESFPAELATAFTWHRVGGIATAVLGVLAFALASSLPRGPEHSRRRTLLRWVLLASVAAVGVTGYLGGALVYGPDHLGF